MFERCFYTYFLFYSGNNCIKLLAELIFTIPFKNLFGSLFSFSACLSSFDVSDETAAGVGMPVVFQLLESTKMGTGQVAQVQILN